MRRAPRRARFALFCCPVCRGDLSRVERRLVCPKGHGFDLAKSGYVNLARPRRHAPAAGGDARPQLEARARFLAGGRFDFIAETIAAEVGAGGAILEVGCGTGHHLARVRALSQARAASGIDLSKAAAAWCARHHPGLDFAVADIWDRWPIHGGAVDLAMSIFAPKNVAEMARVLRPGGAIALVFPGPLHFQELRRGFDLLGVPADKAHAYEARIADDFAAPLRRRVVRRAMMARDEIRDAILMGPNARHLSGLRVDLMPRAMAVTIDVAFLVARKPVGVPRAGADRR